MKLGHLNKAHLLSNVTLVPNHEFYENSHEVTQVFLIL